MWMGLLVSFMPMVLEPVEPIGPGEDKNGGRDQQDRNPVFESFSFMVITYLSPRRLGDCLN